MTTAARCLAAACLIGLQACVGPADPELAEQQQAEIIEVHGCRPGSWDVGDGVCIDPWPGGGGGGPTGGEREPGEQGGGGGGRGDGGPGRKPDRKKCGPELGEEGCLACCDYNYDHVDGWECRKKRTDKAKDECWKKAISEMARCQVDDCNRHGIPPIITTTVP